MTRLCPETSYLSLVVAHPGVVGLVALALVPHVLVGTMIVGWRVQGSLGADVGLQVGAVGDGEDTKIGWYRGQVTI